MTDAIASTAGDADPADLWRAKLIEARRSQILEAAARVFAEKGFHRAKIKEIASVAGIAEGTIYNYFGSKEELLSAMLDRFAFASLKEVFSSQEDVAPEELLKQVFRDRLKFIRTHHHLFLGMFPEVMANRELRNVLLSEQIFPLMEQGEKVIRGGIEAGQLRPVNPRLFTRLAMGALLGFALISLSEETDSFKDMSEEEITDEWMDILFCGLAVRTGEG